MGILREWGSWAQCIVQFHKTLCLVLRRWEKPQICPGRRGWGCTQGCCRWGWCQGGLEGNPKQGKKRGGERGGKERGK